MRLLGTTAALFVAVMCGAGFTAHGQTVTRATDTVKKVRPLPPPKPKGPKPIKHEASGGFRLNSDGWSVFCDLGKVKTKDLRHADMFHSTRILQFEFTEKKDPREDKIKIDNGNGGTNSYIYGKINNFYSLKLAWGFRKMIVGKPDPGTVSIHWVTAGGFALGLLKPYYLNVNNDPSAIKYSDATKPDFLNQDEITGSAGFSKGLSEMKFIPGFHIKSGLHFDFSGNRKNVIAVETGLNFEYYTQDVQIMALQSPVPYFFDMYVGIQVGRRW